ncbi:uncharacterized protein A4U43_C03F11650 [Asparagus officinalis]|uniref:Uncharacterized protein n=1 Tax=Asparagus officinalis TaxID=4686 RepID=A0A5P1F984_ASPOF|nr:uncharacterized protein A4U43_C03F11650 [Asparagus officinalis]
MLGEQLKLDASRRTEVDCEKDVVSWRVIINGLRRRLAFNGRNEQVLQIFTKIGKDESIRGEKIAELRRIMKNGARKTLESSFIDLKETAHEFIAEDNFHP